MSLPFSTAISNLLHSSHISYPIPNSPTLSQFSLPYSRRERSTSLWPRVPQPSLLPLPLPSTRRLLSPVRLYSPSILPSQEPLLSNLSFTSDSLSPAFKHACPVAISRSGCFLLPVPHISQGQESREATIDPRSPMLLPPPAVTIIYQLHTQLKNCIPGSLRFHSTSYHPMLTRIHMIQTTSWPPGS